MQRRTGKNRHHLNPRETRDKDDSRSCKTLVTPLLFHARARAARGHLEERTGGIGLWRRPAA